MAAKARKTSHQVPQFNVIVTRRFLILREWQVETFNEDETSNPRPSDLATSALEFRTPSPPLFCHLAVPARHVFRSGGDAGKSVG